MYTHIHTHTHTHAHTHIRFFGFAGHVGMGFCSVLRYSAVTGIAPRYIYTAD